MKSLSVTIQMKAIEQYFPVVLFIMLYEVVLTFRCVDEITQCQLYPVPIYFEPRWRKRPLQLRITIQMKSD